MDKRTVVSALVLCFLHLVPSSAVGDWLMTPYVGGALFDVPDTGFRPSVGGSFLWSGPVAGLELDVNAIPDFLEGGPVALGKSSLFSLMGNAVVRFPTRSIRVRPYIVAGAGLMHTSSTTVGGVVDSGRSHFAVDAGGGLTIFVTPRVGFRADVRYFRAIQSDAGAAESQALGLEPLQYVRGAAGLALRF